MPSLIRPARAFERINALGEPLPTKASSLKRPARLRPELTRKDDQQMALPDRKIVVEPLEWYVSKKSCAADKLVF